MLLGLKAAARTSFIKHLNNKYMAIPKDRYRFYSYKLQIPKERKKVAFKQLIMNISS